MKKIILLFAFCIATCISNAQITTSPAYLSFVTPVGTISTTQIITASVNVISSTTPHFTITAPSGFMVSFDGTVWDSSISMNLISGATLGIPIYVDFRPTDSSTYSKGLILSVEGLPIISYPLCGNGVCPIMADYPKDSFSVFINEFCAGPQITVATNYYIGPQTVKTYFGDGTTGITTLIDAYGSIAGYVTFNHVYSLPGTYTLKTIILNGTSPVDSLTYTYESRLCRTLPVKFYFDVNGNCNYDPSTDVLNTLPVLTEVDSNGVTVDTVSSSSSFYYNAFGNVGDVYSFKVITPPTGLALSCPTTGIISDTLQTILYNTKTKYFGLVCGAVPSYDISVSSYAFTGRHQQNFIFAINNAFCTPQPEIFTLHFSPKYNFGGSNILPTSVTANTAVWDFGILTLASHPTNLNVTINVPGSWLIPGDTVKTAGNISPTTSDLDSFNNYCVRTDTVKSSYDPNEMTVSPDICIPSGVVTNLQYSVKFENTGNDTAHNIYVMDTLSDNVDPRSLRILAATNVMNVSKSFDNTYHNIFKFEFPSINLLDSSHHNLCDGMFVFSINTRAGLPAGSAIYNGAGIFFDDNPVVMTNIVENLTDCPSSVAIINKQQQIELYPNPATNELNIKTDKNVFSSFTISNMFGQKILQQSINHTDTKVNVATLPVGVYYITFKGNGNEVVKKFVKM